MLEDEKLDQVKNRTWFYQFDLPDGSQTTTDVPPAVLPIHIARRDKLRRIIKQYVPDSGDLIAYDFASHEGYYAIELARHFKQVRGFEIRQQSLEAAQLITDVLKLRNLEYCRADLQVMQYDPSQTADFVLLYGLIYHLENPVHTLRLASQMTRKHILIETQIFPYDMSGLIEDGAYSNQRRVEGVFGLVPDYAARREGGSTDIALVPSLNALLFLMREFGFATIQVLPSGEDEYEQFTRRMRVLIYGQK
ncbi:class I SAM-dependent methyltransferase [Affinirhizobium pseudoryzae]|uniref:class I SAM-dependent methyltransferase n=1 Tax=Allorhizobium pseudoryzae TaxID=379684 RepID=UPI0013EC38CB|nr:methyltransferase domain-containing protein [Allorhizobium pseudoryzae]